MTPPAATTGLRRVFCGGGANNTDAATRSGFGLIGAKREAIGPEDGDADGTVAVGSSNHKLELNLVGSFAAAAPRDTTAEGEVRIRSPFDDARCCVGGSGFGTRILPSESSRFGRTSLEYSMSERAAMESILEHPWTDNRRRCLWLQVLAMEERTVLVSLGQSSSARASSRLCPPRGLWCGIVRWEVVAPRHTAPGRLFLFRVWRSVPQLVVVVVPPPRLVSNRAWTWMSVRPTKSCRVNSRSEESKDDGRKSSR